RDDAQQKVAEGGRRERRAGLAAVCPGSDKPYKPAAADAERAKQRQRDHRTKQIQDAVLRKDGDILGERQGDQQGKPTVQRGQRYRGSQVGGGGIPPVVGEKLALAVHFGRAQVIAGSVVAQVVAKLGQVQPEQKQQ